MEGKLTTKRRRIYSVEPRKIAQAEFARTYLSHLLPALVNLKQQKKMKKKTTNEEDGQKKSCVNVVKREVGMAMVWSAPPGFAWSKALKAKFQTDYTNNAAIINDDDDHHNINAPSSSPYFSAKNPTTTGSSKSCVHNEEEGEEEGFKRLRRLIPGGEEMGDIDEEEMARELESYIRCLQMQVNILQYLAQSP